MNKLALLVLVTLALQSTVASAQVDSLSFKEQSALWRDVSRHPDGYLEVKGSRAQVETVRKFVELSSKIRPSSDWTPPVRCDLPFGFKRIGAMPEFNRRESTFYSKHGNLAMLTVWELDPEQQVTPAFKDMLNTEINGHAGTISLIRHSSRALWKVTWLAKRTNFELYVEDQIGAESKPVIHSSELLLLARGLTCK